MFTSIPTAREMKGHFKSVRTRSPNPASPPAYVRHVEIGTYQDESVNKKPWIKPKTAWEQVTFLLCCYSQTH